MKRTLTFGFFAVFLAVSLFGCVSNQQNTSNSFNPGRGNASGGDAATSNGAMNSMVNAGANTGAGLKSGVNVSGANAAVGNMNGAGTTSGNTANAPGNGAQNQR